ncbi:hypothetical protein [Aureimonas ureilytica]|nr:hypothetical protein [Aureimonas ureilytica]
MSDAPALLAVVVVDGLSGRFSDPAALMSDVIETVNSEWRRCRVVGVGIIDARWSGGRIFLETMPGEWPLTVDAVSEFLQTKRVLNERGLAPVRD